MAAASSNAIVNVGRLNAFRLNAIESGLRRVRESRLTITLDGVPLKVRLGSLQIHDVINDAPNTASLIVDDATPPTVGKRLRVVLGVDPQYLLFVGTLQAARQSYVGKAHADAWECEAIDDTARADWLRPFGAWENVSATNVAYDLITRFMPGFLADGVQLNLPTVSVYLDGTERINGALRLLAKLIGGYYYVEDYVLHLFQGDEPGANPDDVTGAPGQLLDDPRLEATSDDSQIRTRCYGKGHGEPTLSAVTAGDTLIPIANAVMFNPIGGKAISEWQRLTYAGTDLGGTGALVGPGVTPTAAPAPLSLLAGAGMDPGAHSYAYTWVTAAGETLPSPAAAITVTGAVAGPTIHHCSDHQSFEGITGPPAGMPLRYALTLQQGYSGATPESPFGPIVPWTGTGWYVSIAIMNSPGYAGNRVNIYRSDNGGPWGIVNHYNVSTEPVTGVLAGADAAVTIPAYSTPAGNLTQSRVGVSGIATGPSGVTQRKIYRSAANTAAPLRLLGVLADNTTTTFGDTGADAVLGANAPTADTSALQMPAGQVLPGAASMPVSSTAWARAAGGWVIVGNGQQVIRYTGLSGNTITGIPATGTGAIVAAVNYNSTLTGAPMLTGVAGLGAALILGAPVNIWVQVDDAAAQAALAARVGGSGIVEQLIQDERRGEPSLIALCTADLGLYGRPIVTIQYTTFDPKSRSGRPVRVHLAQPAIDQTLMIQDVTISTSGTNSRPRFTVTASSVRTSFEDLLRRLVGTLEEGF